MSREIIERVFIATAERPIKGFALDQALYVADTKQGVLDEQSVSLERTAKLVVWAKDIQKFMLFSDDGSTHEEKDFPSGDFKPDDYAKTGENALFQTIRSNYGNDPVKHSLELKQDSNRWSQLTITNNLVLWQWDHPDDVTKTEKTRFLTVAQSGFDFERSPKYLGVRLATVEELPMVNVDGVLQRIKSISTGDGIALNYDVVTGDLKLTNDANYHEFKYKTMFDNAVSDTNSSGEGTLYQFTGGGSAFSTHRHEFNDDGVIWVLNLQDSLRGKFVNLSSSVGSVQATSCEVPANMVARFTYSKEANAINIEMSYFRGDLAKYVTEEQLESEVDEHVNDYLIHNLADLVDARMNAKEIKSPFTNAQSIQIDVSHLDNPDVTVYVTDGSKLKKVKPAIQRDLVTGHLQIDFISPKTGLIVIRSH